MRPCADMRVSETEGQTHTRPRGARERQTERKRPEEAPELELSQFRAVRREAMSSAKPPLVMTPARMRTSDFIARTNDRSSFKTSAAVPSAASFYATQPSRHTPAAPTHTMDDDDALLASIDLDSITSPRQRTASPQPPRPTSAP